MSALKPQSIVADDMDEPSQRKAEEELMLARYLATPSPMTEALRVVRSSLPDAIEEAYWSCTS